MKKNIAKIMLALSVVGVLAGCGKTEGNTEGNTEATSVEAAATTGEAEEEPTVDPAGHSLMGSEQIVNFRYAYGPDEEIEGEELKAKAEEIADSPIYTLYDDETEAARWYYNMAGFDTRYNLGNWAIIYAVLNCPTAEEAIAMYPTITVGDYLNTNHPELYDPLGIYDGTDNVNIMDYTNIVKENEAAAIVKDYEQGFTDYYNSHAQDVQE